MKRALKRDPLHSFHVITFNSKIVGRETFNQGRNNMATKKRETLSSLYQKTKGVVGETLAGAAAGAVVGASATIVETVSKGTVMEPKPTGDRIGQNNMATKAKPAAKKTAAKKPAAKKATAKKTASKSTAKGTAKKSTGTKSGTKSAAKKAPAKKAAPKKATAKKPAAKKAAPKKATAAKKPAAKKSAAKKK